MEARGVICANDHGEGIRETEWFGECEMKAAGVRLLDAVVDRGGSVIGRRSFVENGGKRCAGVLDVKIDIA